MQRLNITCKGRDLISVWYIVIALLVFGVLIFIHESGHFFAARIFKVSIREFAIGMGPKIFSHVSKKNGIKYSLRLLPIGGFVSMVGEDEDSDDENAFNKKPVWQRIIITSAGAFMNIFVGIIVMAVVVASSKSLGSNVIALLPANENGVNYSYEAGMRVGDEIIKVDGVRVHIANETLYEIMRRGINPTDITVKRGGEIVTLENVQFPVITEEGTNFGMIDFKVLSEEKNLGTVLKHSFFRSLSTIKMIWESLYDLITGRYGLDAVSGPVGVTKALGEAAKEGGMDLLYLAVIISMNLGVMNLLPLPALDGGRLLFQIVEVVRRRPVKPEIEGYIHFAGFVILMILMVIIAVKDVISLI